MLRYLVILSLFAACGTDGPQEVPATCGVGLEPYSGAVQRSTLTLWVQDDLELPRDLIMEACLAWSDAGVTCTWAASEKLASVRVTASHDACDKNDAGTYTLATTYEDGHMVFSLECIRRWYETEADGSPNRQVMLDVGMHEMGHELGMPHVPTHCDLNEATDDTERAYIRQGICGKALMNPMIDLNACMVTQLDGEGYLHRNDRAPAFIASETKTGCTIAIAGTP